MCLFVLCRVLPTRNDLASSSCQLQMIHVQQFMDVLELIMYNVYNSQNI